jgi:hypothetical protein
MPAYRGLEIPTAKSLLSLVWALEGRRGEPKVLGQFEFLGADLEEGYGACRNSEEAARVAMDAGADVLLHVDADMEFTPEHVARLLFTWEQLGEDAVVGALYRSSRGGPYVGRLTGVEGVDADGTTAPLPAGCFTAQESVAALQAAAAVVSAEVLGFGFIAIPTSLLRELVASRGYAFEEDTRGRALFTADARFSEEARRRDWRLAADLAVRPRHLQRRWE